MHELWQAGVGHFDMQKRFGLTNTSRCSLNGWDKRVKKKVSWLLFSLQPFKLLRKKKDSILTFSIDSLFSVYLILSFLFTCTNWIIFSPAPSLLHSESILANFLEKKLKLLEPFLPWDSRSHPRKVCQPWEKPFLYRAEWHKGHRLWTPLQWHSPVQDRTQSICKHKEELHSVTTPDSLWWLLGCSWCKPGSKISDVAQWTEKINNAKE